MNNPVTVKTYTNTFIYSKLDENGMSAEQHLIAFMKEKDCRINKSSDAFSQIRNEIKMRQTSAVLYRLLMSPDLYLVISNERELPASFKVFRAKDIFTLDKKPAVFIDCTGLIEFKNGYYICKNIDRLCTYLFGAMVIKLYNENSTKLLANVNIMKPATQCFVKLFTGVLDNLRVVNYNGENIPRISYISAVYFLYSVCKKDINSAQSLAATAVGISPKEANGYNYWYDPAADMKDINSFVNFLANTFKLKGLTLDVYINRWITLYGKGTLYGLELFPIFLNMIGYAYVGSYVNNQKAIENACGKNLVTLTKSLLTIGSSTYDTGFRYESGMRDDIERNRNNNFIVY